MVLSQSHPWTILGRQQISGWSKTGLSFFTFADADDDVGDDDNDDDDDDEVIHEHATILNFRLIKNQSSFLTPAPSFVGQQQ